MSLPSYNFSDLSETLVRTDGKPGDLDATLLHIAQAAQKFFATDICIIFAINPITDDFVRSQIVAEDSQQREHFNGFPELEQTTRQILKKGMLFVADLQTVPEYQTSLTRSEAIRAFVALPLRIQHDQKSLGVLYFYFKRSLDADADYEAFRLFMQQASFTLQETWLLRRQQEVARIGYEINQDLGEAVGLFEKLQRHTAGILDTSGSFLLEIYQPQTHLVDMYLYERNQSTVRLGKLPGNACKYVLNHKEVLFIRNRSEETSGLPIQPDHIEGTDEVESLIFVPLVLQKVSLGVLSIQHPQPNVYSDEDLFILQLLANHIALALYNMRLYKSLKQLNEAGQFLTQQLDPKQTLQATVDKIKETTQADLVLLYSFRAMLQRFDLPIHISGDFLNQSSHRFITSQSPDSTLTLMLNRARPIFYKESTDLYKELHSNRSQSNFQQREQIRSAAAVSLIAKDEPVGVLFINFRKEQPFDTPQKSLIEGLGLYAAAAIKNSRVLDAFAQRRISELEMLQFIDRELNRNLDLDSVLNTLLVHANKQVPVDEAAIVLYNSQTQMLEIKATIGRNATTRKTLTFSLNEAKSITRWVLEQKEPARVSNVRTESPWKDLYFEASSDTVSELDVPLFDEDEIIGVLNCERTTEDAFSEEDERLLLTLAGQAVLAIKKTQAYEREKRLAIESEAINAISKEIIGQLDHKRVFSLILKKALSMTRSNMGNLMLYDPDLRDLWVADESEGVVEGKKKQRQRLDQGIVGHVASTREPLIVDISKPLWQEKYLAFFSNARSELAVPMLAGDDELRGVLNVENPNPNHFSLKDQELLERLADLAVIALQNSERFEIARAEAQRFQLLYRTSKELGELAKISQSEEAYDIVLNIAGEKCEGQVIIQSYDKDTQELITIRTLERGYNPPRAKIKVEGGIYERVVREQRTLVVLDTETCPQEMLPLYLPDDRVRSLVIAPITFNRRYFGNLVILHKEAGHFRLGISHQDVNRFQQRDDTFFESLALQLASTIYRLETVQERQDFEQRVHASEIMSSIGQYAMELTHRLGNDLGSVELQIDEIREEQKRKNRNESLIQEELNEIVNAVHNVLKMSRDFKQNIADSEAIEADNKYIVVPAKVFLEEALRSVSLPSNIHMVLDMNEEVGKVSVIPSAINDIFRHLILNACEAMPDGGKIILSAHNDNRYIALEVRDTGTGIPKELQSRIFELFFSTKHSSGFGLWSARSKAFKNGGELMVESQPGHGATFRLLLPREDDGVL